MRRGYLDWMRGLAVIIMIEAHVIDSWTRVADRQAAGYGWSMILGGFGAPLFLFLAGLSVVLSASAKERRFGDRSAATRAVVRRGLEIFALAFLFRVQAWILGWGSPSSLLKVDILNIMGPSIAAAAVLWSAGGRRSPADVNRALVFAAAALVMTFVTPLVRATPLLAPLPDPLEGYLRPRPGYTNFSFFPWAGFVFAGGVLGVAIERSRTRESETRLNIAFFVGGVALALAASAASFLPSPYARSEFWTSSPAFFLIRVGIMTAVTALAYAWVLGRQDRWSPVQQLGRTSLFIYWIHVEMVYGLLSLRLHKALPLGAAWLAFGGFCIVMLGCSLAKDRVVRWWRGRRSTPRAPAGTGPVLT